MPGHDLFERSENAGRLTPCLEDLWGGRCIKKFGDFGTKLFQVAIRRDIHRYSAFRAYHYCDALLYGQLETSGLRNYCGHRRVLYLQGLESPRCPRAIRWLECKITPCRTCIRCD